MFLASFVGLPGCSEISHTTKLEFLETQCANFWDEENSWGDTEVMLKDYLEQKGIEVHQISIRDREDTWVDCRSCNCSNGNIICIKVDDADVAYLIERGFEFR